jgi:hypothetical protein
MKRLNLGCGKDIKKGYLNLDICKLPGVDVAHDLSKFPYPFKDNEFDEIMSFGTIELINADFIKIMEELWRICENKAVIKVRCPAFPNMCSAQDPLTKKFMTYRTFDYFCEHGHYSKARFKIKTQKYIFSINKMAWVNSIINSFPVFYSRFLFNLFPATTLYFELEVVK